MAITLLLVIILYDLTLLDYNNGKNRLKKRKNLELNEVIIEKLNILKERKFLYLGYVFVILLYL